MEATKKKEFNLMVDYHKNIKHLREFKNYTQEFMADELGISQRAFSSIENGSTHLTVDRLYKIANILQVSVGEIIGVETHNIYNTHFNNNATNNKGDLVFTKEPFDKERELYERLLTSKDDEIAVLVGEVKTLQGKSSRR